MNNENYCQEEINQEEKLHFYEKMLKDLQDQALIWEVSFEIGGQKFYIPKKVKGNHFFNRYGVRFFEWLVENYAGDTIVFPSGNNNTYKRNKRQAELLALRGFSNNEISRQLGLHYSSSQRARNRIKENIQGDLFD